MISILGWILFGLIIGALAKLVMPGRDPGGILITMLLGIAGAVLCICSTFSSSVIRETRSAARFSGDKAGLR